MDIAAHATHKNFLETFAQLAYTIKEKSSYAQMDKPAEQEFRENTKQNIFVTTKMFSKIYVYVEQQFSQALDNTHLSTNKMK